MAFDPSNDLSLRLRARAPQLFGDPPPPSGDAARTAKALVPLVGTLAIREPERQSSIIRTPSPERRRREAAVREVRGLIEAVVERTVPADEPRLRRYATKHLAAKFDRARTLRLREALIGLWWTIVNQESPPKPGGPANPPPPRPRPRPKP